MKKVYYSVLSTPWMQLCQVLPVAGFLQNIFNKKNIRFNNRILFFLCFTLLTSVQNNLYADVTLTTSPLAAGDINQGTNRPGTMKYSFMI